MTITGLNTTFQLDKQFGDKGEGSVLPKLRKFFNDDTIKPTTSKYCLYDYEADNGSIYELKSRRIRRSTYPTTIIPTHKIINGKIQYFVFNFLDTISYIKYDADLFKTFRIEDITDGRYQSYKPSVPHYHIPTDSLTDFI